MSIEFTEEEIINTVINVFSNVDKTDILEPSTQWFNTILEQLKVFGFNNIFNLHGKILSYSTVKIKPRHKYVRISNYSIFEVQALYRRVLIENYNQPEDWSHPGVFFILKHFTKIKEKMFALSKHNDYTAMKMFCNMIVECLKIYRCGLHIKGFTTVSDFYDLCRTFIEKRLVDLAPIENIVVIDIDTILLNSNLPHLPYGSLEIFEHKHGINFKCASNLECGADPEWNNCHAELNRICREYAINIIP